MDRLKEIARENGWFFNPDIQKVKRIVSKMTDSFDRYGDYYCPGKQVGDPPLCGMDVLCPCPEAAYEIATSGYCFCRLFYAVEVTSRTEISALDENDPSTIFP
ncbi:ferredoxin-thioredoxin reductase catalytic domain-containing protein [Planctomycetota bacterium]